VSFFIAYVSGRSGRGRASSRKRASLDSDKFETYEAAEEVAKARWPDGGYFIIEARDARSAEAQAIEESLGLDDASS
jgi:hypothetical protein